MAVLQPLYISQGRYTPGVDRKILAGIFDTTSVGELMHGVLPPTDHFKASASGTTVSVSAGFCIIPDSPSQSSDSPGAYFCSIDAASEQATAATTGIALSTPGTYKIYAEVSEVTKNITKAEFSATNVATIRTSTAHGYAVGQTVLINAINDTYNGSYVITAVTTSSPYTFSFSKVGTTGVGTVGDGSATIGTSSVPFAIKYNTIYPQGTANYTPIATAVSTGSAITLTDERYFVSGRSGIQLYRSTTANGSQTTAAQGAGRMSYDLDTDKLYAFVNGAPKLLIDGTTGHHDSASTGTAGSIHHLIGTGAYDAAAGNHTHTSRVLTPQSAYDGSLAQGSLSTSSASPTQITGASVTITLPTTPDEQWVLISGTVTIRSTAVSGSNTNFCRVGIETNATGTTDDDIFTGASTIAAVNGVETTQCVPFTRLVKFSVAGDHVVNLMAYRNNTNSVFEINQFYLTAVPVNYV